MFSYFTTELQWLLAGNTKRGSITIPLTSLFDWFGLVCFANKNKIVSCHTADSKPVKEEVNGTLILPPLVFPAFRNSFYLAYSCLIWNARGLGTKLVNLFHVLKWPPNICVRM